MVLIGASNNISAWDGTISPHDFSVAAGAFIDKWRRFNSVLPHWSWVSCPKRSLISFHQVEGYLSLEGLFLPSSVQVNGDGSIQNEIEECDCSDEDEPADNAVVALTSGRGVHHYNFHVVYSATYKVPVLYFQAYYRDGQLLSLEDIEEGLPANSSKALMECKWTFITLEEHSYLNRPWYTLHPCGTSEWMKLLLTKDASVGNGIAMVEQYLVSWFSVVGQVFGLKLPLEMWSRESKPEQPPVLENL